jgi:hypothetical protein
MKDILTLALEGEVVLQEFASAISTFNSLLIELSAEVGGSAKIDWIIDELHEGSAIATFRGVYPEMALVENVVNAYEEIGSALASGSEIPFSDSIRKHSAALTSILNGKITALRFETSSNEYFISGKVQGKITTSIKYTYGTVKGTVETLSKHKKLSFTLWDAVFEKPVHCYFKDGEEENMRNIWGKKAVVSGKVGRQPHTGRVVVVREVNYVRAVEEVLPGSYRSARGILPWGKGDETAEDMIRRLRDAN